MATNIIMPKQGISMKEGTIIKWYVAEGDRIKMGDMLASVETNKFVNDIESRVSGVVKKIIVPEGETVAVNTVIAIVGAPDEVISDVPAVETQTQTAAAEEPAAAHAETQAPAVGSRQIKAAPRARALAKKLGISLESIVGTGKQGLITEKDVELAQSGVSSPETSAVEEPAAGGQSLPECVMDERREAISPVRRATAKIMCDSLHEAAQTHHRVHVDMTECVNLRASLKAKGQPASYNDILIRAVAQALVQYPYMNAEWAGDALVMRHDAAVGLAVATDRDELFVPVVHSANRKTLMQISAETREIVRKARENQLGMDDTLGGTFTISNLGMFGIDEFVAILNPPQTGILAVGGIVDKTVVINKQVEIRPMMTMTLTYDHRVVDGAYAAKFLAYIKSLIEAPFLML